MRTKIKTVCIALIAGLLLSLCGCGVMSDPDRITRIYFLSATGAGLNDNCFSLSEGQYTYARQTLKSEDALELIKKVNELPDNEGDEADLAYIIELNYIEDGAEKHVKKYGYGSFPDNWEEIVDLVNKATANYAEISDSRDISVIDADYLRSSTFYQNEDELPDGMTLDDVIRDMPITYKTLCDYRWNENDIINDYLYDYFGLASNQMTELDEDPPSSSGDDLKAFAGEKLDEIDWDHATSGFIGGTYNGCSYWVFKYDEFRYWYDEEDYYRDDYFERSIYQRDTSRGLVYYVYNNNGPEGMYQLYQDRDIYVDSSGRFLIMTDCKVLKDIYAVVS